MDKKQRQDRARLIKELYERTLRSIYLYQEKRKLKAMAELAQRNQAIRNTPMPCFMFKGVWYTYPYNAVMPRDTSEIDRCLDISLKTEAHEIIKSSSDFEFIEAKAHIADFLRKIFQTCRTIACVNSFLPADLQLPMDLSQEFDCGTPLEPEERDALQKAVNKGSASLKQLYMMKILMARVA